MLLQQKPWVCLKQSPQGDWVRALWSEMVLGLSLREWGERENVPPSISNGNYDHLHIETVGPSEDRRGAIDLLNPRRLIYTTKREWERVPRVKSPSKLREPVDGTSMPVTPTPTVT